MVFEGIDNYLDAVRLDNLLNGEVDQRVPQFASSLENIMFNSEMHVRTRENDFIPDEELFFNRNYPVAVQNFSPEQAMFHEETKLQDLDESQLSIYSDSSSNSDTLVKNCSNTNFDTYYGYENAMKMDNPAFRSIKSEPGVSECQTYSETDDYATYDFSTENVDQAAFRSSSLKSEQCVNQCEDFITTEDIQKQAYEVCVKDIRLTCNRLNIPLDPHLWTVEQCHQWIIYQCEQYNVSQPNLSWFNFIGADLCNLKEDFFKCYAPDSWQTLMSRLEIWRSVADRMTLLTEQTSPCVAPVVNIPVPRSPAVLPCSHPTGSLSPHSVNYTDDDSQPSTPPYYKPEDVDRLPDERPHHHRQTIQLWQFLKLLLIDGNYTDCIRWLDRSRGIFKIENSQRVARLWGKRKNRPAMNYDKLSRSIRQYYKKNIIKKTVDSKRLVYQFCERAEYH